MTNTLTTAQASARNEQSFTRQLQILDQAAVGVVLCRTREPHRAIDVIQRVAFSRQLPLKVWRSNEGWRTFQPNGDEGAPDATCDANMAMQMIGGFNNTATTNGEPGLGDGFYVSFYPQTWLKQDGPDPRMVQAIKDYCRMFAHSETVRLILLAPVGYTLPPELEEDVTILDFEVPSYAELLDMLNHEIADIEPASKRPMLTATDKDALVSAGSGMQLSEFQTAWARAIVTYAAELPNVGIEKLVAEIMRVKTEVVKRSEVLEIMPVTNMENVGGLQNLKDWLRQRSYCFGQEAADFGIEKPKGIALIGPPGTGKSLLAKAAAHALNKPLIKFDVSRVFAGLVGQSEARVRSALKMIDAMAPCVVLLDEVDKAFQRNSGGGDSGVSQRVLGNVLTHMQESDAGVFWVATANRVDNLPSEFLRRGRLDEVFSVSVPDEEERLEVIRIHLRKRGHDPDGVDGLEAAVAASEGYVPAELEAAVKDAIIEAFADGQRPVTGDDVVRQLQAMTPLSVAFREDFDRMKVWAENNARPASANRKNPSDQHKPVAAPKAAAGRRRVIVPVDPVVAPK